MRWIIYRHLNKINGKSYIGQTCQIDLNLRFKNGNGYKRSKLFYKAIKKYGWENFEHIILDQATTKKQANKKEIYYINYYHTFIGDPQCNGYNMTLGGDENNGYYLAKAVYKVALDGKIIESYSSKMEAARAIGVANSSYVNRCCKKPGQYSTQNFYFCLADDYNICLENIKKKQSEKQFLLRKKQADIIEKQRLKLLNSQVLQIDSSLNIVNEFDSISAAEKVTGISHSSISMCCNKKQKFAGNYYWCFKKDFDNIIFTGLNPNYDEEVYQLNSDLQVVRKFKNIYEAQQITKLINIHSCLNGKFTSTGGYFWCLAKDYSTFKVKPFEYKYAKVDQFDLDGNYIKTFNSVSDAARELNLHQSLISYCCAGKRKTTGGFIWKFTEKE